MPRQPNPRNRDLDSIPHQPEATLFMRPWVEAKARQKLLAIALVTGESGNDFPHLDAAAAAARLAPERRGVDHRSGLNALFYVAPGTNKTELVCVLAGQ